MPQPRKFLVISAFAALYVIWGSTYLGILFAIQSIPPFLMAGARFLLAGLIMFAIARTQSPLKSSWGEWRTAVIVAACLLLGGKGGGGGFGEIFLKRLPRFFVPNPPPFFPLLLLVFL